MRGQSIGTCFGFAIRSSLPFHYLRSGDGDPLEVSSSSRLPDDGEGELVIEWTPTPSLPFAAALYRQDGRLLLSMGSDGWFVIDTEKPSIVVPEDPDTVRREERLWNLPAVLCLIARGYLPLHAAAIDVGGRALVFGAPRGFGKTTLAAAFVNAGHRLLSEDLVCLRLGESVEVLPGPAMLRVRPDVARELTIERASRLRETDERVHFAIDESERGDGNPVPLRSIVLLRRSERGFRFESVPSAQAVPDLWKLTFGLPTEDERRRAFTSVVDVVRSTPVSNLHRPTRLDELARTVEYLVARF